MDETSLKLASGTAPKAPARSRCVFGPFTLDPLRSELLRDGQVIPLPPKAFDLLIFLTSRPGEVLAKDQLIAAVWPGVVVTDDSLTHCVHELRAALGDAGSALLHTVPRRGYRFDADVQPARPASAADLPTTPAPRNRRLVLLLGALLVAAIALAALAWNLASRKPSAAIPHLSLVLLPLEGQDDAATGTWFADALTADLNAELGRIASVLVISTATAAAYRGKAGDPREVSRALLAKQHIAGLSSDWEAFVAVTKMTTERYPNHAPSYSGLSRGLVSLGRFDECVELSQRSMRLSPRDPLLGAWNWHLGNCHFMRGEYKAAAAAARLAGQISPNLPLPPLLLAASLARDRKADEARPIVAAYMQRHPDYQAADVAKIMHGENPVYAAGRGRLIDSLRELGMP